jgi:Rod binding domain-containing protein
MNAVTLHSPINVGPTVDPSNIKDAGGAAKEFEAILIASMLKTMREADDVLSGEQDAAGASAIGFAEEHLARTLSSQGGLGLARLVSEGLGRENTPTRTDQKIEAAPHAAQPNASLPVKL